MFRIQVLSYRVSYLRETISAHCILLTRIGLVKHEKFGALNPVNFPKLLKLIEGGAPYRQCLSDLRHLKVGGFERQ